MFYRIGDSHAKSCYIKFSIQFLYHTKQAGVKLYFGSVKLTSFVTFLRMKKFKVFSFLVGSALAQTGCAPTSVCPDMGQDFSCGVLLNTFPDPEVKY